MSLFGKLHDFVEKGIHLFTNHYENKDTQHSYNYTYFPPIALVQKVPFDDVAFDWLLKVLKVQFRIILNLLAVTTNENLDQEAARLETIFAKNDRHNDVLKTIKELADLAEDLEKVAPHSIGEFVRVLRNIIVKLTAEDSTLVVDALDLYLVVQNALLKDDAYTWFDSIQDYKDLFVFLPLPKIAETFEQDESFADMRVAGPNPTTLERLTAPKANFPVDNATFQRVMGADDDITQAMAEGRVYAIDYAALSAAVPGTYGGPQKFIGAPIAMFAVPKSGDDKRLRPVAIQCGQTPGEAYPLITPPSDPNNEDQAARWSMAKAFFQVADGNYHEAIAHLGRTHYLISPFSVATPNELGEDHPVGKLLMPHFQGTFSINNAAQASLIASEGIIDQIMGGTIDASRLFGAAGAREITMNLSDNYFPATLKERQVDDASKLPYYPYRDCGMKVWNAIHDWVSAYLAIHYTTEDGPGSDEQIKNWYQEVTSHLGGRTAGFGEDGTIKTRSELTDVVTMVIFTASAAHAAVNFPQNPIMSFAPAMPLAAFKPPPTASGTYTRADYLKMLPPKLHAVVQQNTGALLGNIYFTQLGQYGDHYFKDKASQNAMKDFQAALAKIEDEISQEFPDYPYLLPSQIPQSINI
jgi:arachidonate 15-lipoxygenase